MKTRPKKRSAKDRSSPSTRATAPVKGIFAELAPELRRALAAVGYSQPTPIQAQAIPHLLAGRDLFGCAQTGTGKTAAFSLPLLQSLLAEPGRPLAGRPHALILAPTRELAAQIDDSIGAYARFTRLHHAVIFGGVNQYHQVRALRRGVDIVVATPGRLLDLMQQGEIALAAVRLFVLDEGDRMLDMGFLPDVRRIAGQLPAERQSLLFSATLPKPIEALAGTLVQDPVRVTTTPGQQTVEKISQKILFVEKKDKGHLLANLLAHPEKQRVIVFTRMKYAANRVSQKLCTAGIPAAAIHGNKSQNARTQALTRFKRGRTRVLVATDIAARGIDVQGISHVVNYDLPLEAEMYVHRIGRTARAGAGGEAISFCSPGEGRLLRDIQKLLRLHVPVDKGHAYHSEAARRDAESTGPPAGRQSRSGPSPRRRRSRPFAASWQRS